MKRFSVNPVGSTKQRYVSETRGGGEYSGMVSTRSGSPNCQGLSLTGTGSGASAGSPCGVPESIQARKVARSSSERAKESRNSPMPGVGFQGGIFFSVRTRLMSSAYVTTSSYDII